MTVKITALQRTYPFVRPFHIARQTYDDAPVVEVVIAHDGMIGRGEAAGVDYRGETSATMLDQIAAISARCNPDRLLDRSWLQRVMPPGGARNALDCALWDLEAKQAGVRACALAGRTSAPVATYITIGLDTPEVMARDASAFGPDALIKIKLGGRHDRECLRAVRDAAPDAKLLVDANQAWTYAGFLAFEDDLLANQVVLVEQPLPAGGDACLCDYRGAVALCADESCHDRSSLPGLIGRYDFVNIKLDKTGGLTEALALADEARRLGFRLMVGCMGGSSLGIAPALLIAQQCEVVDLDCPLQLRRDIDDGLQFSGHVIGEPSPRLWG